MSALVHLFTFLLSAAIIWFFAGLLIESVVAVARRFHQSGFTIAFFVLGFLTSISEISVMVNSSLENTPQVSAGNLAGASFVILLLIVPLVAIVGKGIKLKNTLHHRNLGIALLAVALPTLLMIDGSVSKSEGLVCLMVYVTLIYFIRKQRRSTPRVLEDVKEELIHSRKITIFNFVKIFVGAIFIFVAGHLLVQEATYFSILLSIPSSIIGLLLLSIGTNIPELVIAVRSVMKGRNEIAFGDYLGSTVTNTLVFGFLPFLNGRFAVEPSEFIVTGILMVIGFIAFFIFSKSKNTITKQEGIVLVSIYGMFVIMQLINFVRFATD